MQGSPDSYFDSNSGTVACIAARKKHMQELAEMIVLFLFALNEQCHLADI